MDVKITRRDMIEVEQLAGKNFSQLFPDGEATALGTLALGYITERRAAKDAWTGDEEFTFITFDEYLDQDIDVESMAGEEENPT